MSQPRNAPVELQEIAIPSFVCRPTNVIGVEASCVAIVSVATGSVDEVSIFQNLTNSSPDEIREEENVREVKNSVCPIKVLKGWEFELVMSQT